jgi:hypothetical protein
MMMVFVFFSSYGAFLNVAYTELEPRRLRNEAVDIFVDLAATLEDHTEASILILLTIYFDILPPLDWKR